MKNIKEYIGSGKNRKEIRNFTSLDSRFCYFHINVLYLFNERADEDKIKDSLRKTLNYFPELEGRLIGKASCTLKMDCCGKGILYISENSSKTLSDVREDNYYDFLEELDFDKTISGKEAVMAVKITNFSDGKTAVGITVNHSVTDACGMFNFINAWSDIYNGKEIKTPFEKREILEKNPGEPIFELNELIPDRTEGFMYIDESETETHFNQYRELKKESIENKILKIKKTELENMKKEAEKYIEDEKKWVSTNDVLSAHLWKIISEIYGEKYEKERKLLMVSNIRGKKEDEFIPENFFGNGVAHIITQKEADELADINSGKLALEIRENINNHNSEKIKEQMKWLKSKLGKVVFAEFNPFEGDISISSFYKFPIYELEMGMGKAEKAMLPPVYCPGVIRIMPQIDGGADVYLSMYREDMEVIKSKEYMTKLHKYDF